MGYKILAINPGSTSTKIAVYEDENMLFSKSINHSANELEKYNTITDQFEMRKESILNILQERVRFYSWKRRDTSACKIRSLFSE